MIFDCRAQSEGQNNGLRAFLSISLAWEGQTAATVKKAGGFLEISIKYCLLEVIV